METGNITQIAPNGGYTGRNGYIYTFDMIIQTASGMVQGEIGSKSEMYPLNVGDEINFTTKQTDHGVKIKKVSPEYAGGGGQSAPSGQSGGRPSSGNKDRLIVAQVVYKAQMEKNGSVTADKLAFDVDMIMTVGTG